MKKWIVSILMIVFAAGISVADNHSPWWKFGFGGNDDEQIQAEQMPQGPRGERPAGQKQRRSKMSEEQRVKMKAHYEEIQALSEAARTETDPVKKEELTNQLRAKLTENAVKMQGQFRKRVEKAEKELAKMKERLDKGEADLEQRVEEHLQKLLAGEKMGRRGGNGGKEGQRPKGPSAE